MWKRWQGICPAVSGWIASLSISTTRCNQALNRWGLEAAVSFFLVWVREVALFRSTAIRKPLLRVRPSVMADFLWCIGLLANCRLLPMLMSEERCAAPATWPKHKPHLIKPSPWGGALVHGLKKPFGNSTHKRPRCFIRPACAPAARLVEIAKRRAQIALG